MGDNWNFFREQLLAWYRPERRPMPWKEERDPYLIWLSEIILQQTRVEQGRAYFERFKAAYPTVEALAAAPDDEVMKLWEGLGYYSRARNLLKAARLVVREFGGKFPSTHEGLLQLPGVGPYTAAAIGSFAFGLPLPVLDGNVYRILARYAGADVPIDTTTGKHRFTALAREAFAAADPARYNQAIMDFGAMVCKPKAARCTDCILRTHCAAYQGNRVYDLPVKSKRIKRRTRYFHFLVITDEAGRQLIQRREEKDIWRDLYQFPLVETIREIDSRKLPSHPDWPEWLPETRYEWLSSTPPRRQQLTHQEVIARFHRLSVEQFNVDLAGYEWVNEAMLSSYAFPKVIVGFLAEKNLYLDLF